MSAKSPAELRADLSNSLLELSENFGPVLDMADGFKADLERRGWSATAAETVAVQWLVGAMEASWKQAMS